MPIRPELRHHYGQEWRTETRPAALIRACYECERCALPDRPMGLRSALEGAHLDGNPANIIDTNIAILCHACHKAHDYPEWARKCRETRIEHKDAARPILALLLGLSCDETTAGNDSPENGPLPGTASEPAQTPTPQPAPFEVFFQHGATLPRRPPGTALAAYNRTARPQRGHQ